jgi:RecQ family ATP-dependent DNA helicase
LTLDPALFLSRCISVDLEVDPKSARLFAFAAVRGEQAMVHRTGPWASLEIGLNRLEALCDGAAHLVGHNILRHDLPHLVANRARLAGLGAAPIDTLWLNPLAFPRNPYHHLVKHYQDGRLQVGHVNDPEQDARLALQVLADQIAAFTRLGQEAPDALLAYHHLTTRGEASGGFDALFQSLRGPAPGEAAAYAAIHRLLDGRACDHRLEQTLGRLSDPRNSWPMAYALSWISVAGGDSVMPPWVRLQFPQAGRIVRHLRDTNCGDPACTWCAEKNNPNAALERWFGFPSFRPQPVDDMGRPLQERIVAEAMAGKSVLGILPTGTGKSVCYQIPALSRFDKTGGLTVVISPLVALMADQVQGLARAGISAAVTVNGMLSLPERHDALEKVRMGDAAMLLISPEQLRSPSIRTVLQQREVGLWVLDEAHCVSKWGHDFRPDYRYVSRFIKEFSGDSPAPVLCLTATAKPEVVRDIRDHFQTRLGVDLMLLDGGAVRTNLSFAVLPTQKATKLSDILVAIEANLPPEGASGAVVYCATRGATEKVAEFLKGQGLAADFFHAGLPPDRKREVQEAFRTGHLRVIAATNAFGMGIDKPDIRLVVHGDIPGSLENYLQEAGRAGRDGQPSRCLLLYNPADRFVQEFFIESAYPARDHVAKVYGYLCRIDADPIELTQQEIKERLQLPIGSEGVGACEQLLESAGVLERLVSAQNLASVRLDSDLPTLVDLLPRQATVRRKVLRAVEKLVGMRRNELVHFHPREILKELEIDANALAHALRELNALKEFTYVPPFRGRAIRMIHRDAPFETLPIDFDTLERRKAAEYEKLQRVIRFALSSRCRQQEILQYFGDEDQGVCGHCDNCRRAGIQGSPRTERAKPHPNVVRTVRIVLSGAARTQARFRCGKNLIAQMLCGSDSARLHKLGLNRLSTFGLLRHLTQIEVVAMIDGLVAAGYLEQEAIDRHRRVVQLTARGADLMREKTAMESPPPFPADLLRKLQNGPEPPSGSPARSAAPPARHAEAPARAGALAHPPHYWTWRLLAAGFSADECAAIRSLSRETILDHALKALEEGHAVPVEQCLSKDLLAALKRLIRTAAQPDDRLLLAKLPAGTTHQEVQLFLAAHRASPPATRHEPRGQPVDTPESPGYL